MDPRTASTYLGSWLTNLITLEPGRMSPTVSGPPSSSPIFRHADQSTIVGLDPESTTHPEPRARVAAQVLYLSTWRTPYMRCAISRIPCQI
jgi:hypothetical protein